MSSKKTQKRLMLGSIGRLPDEKYLLENDDLIKHMVKQAKVEGAYEVIKQIETACRKSVKGTDSAPVVQSILGRIREELGVIR